LAKACSVVSSFRFFASAYFLGVHPKVPKHLMVTRAAILDDAHDPIAGPLVCRSVTSENGTKGQHAVKILLQPEWKHYGHNMAYIIRYVYFGFPWSLITCGFPTRVVLIFPGCVKYPLQSQNHSQAGIDERLKAGRQYSRTFRQKRTIKRQKLRHVNHRVSWISPRCGLPRPLTASFDNRLELRIVKCRVQFGSFRCVQSLRHPKRASSRA
jgi:hypothetical protein